ncbi:hypothetical protein F5B22DRAFT_647758 [Xylaria bambusicola]|uniref:uncharacterized protein n=1 Tax=Xylaria bambusicola TaxID=326684 RepID=UPI002008D41F|nr:uncharacterized protein F5B22DRAFT_647758 [Xylaria bambusicola]KAI0514449.1 hypothetical protein F5B22DRAFT_647758 [Xylaria bambusicola]
MVHYRMIAVAGFLASVNGLPLNINLGAYSPALVVGDGEISFGGGQDVTSLLNALEGAAVNSAGASNGAAANNAAAEDIQALANPATTTNAAAAEETTVAVQATETVVATPVATPDATPSADPSQEEQVSQTVGVQGMGKEIAPRIEEQQKAKRDLAGFDRALTYAEAALTKGPIIQLGTGEGGAGVGIIVDNRPDAAAPGGEEKRDEISLPRRRTKVTRMYLKRGIPAAIQNSPDFETRAVKTLPVVNSPALAKRDSSDAIDAINLNIAGDEGVTMTFIETTDGDDDDEAQESVTTE